jgi:hypothetical protein
MKSIKTPGMTQFIEGDAGHCDVYFGMTPHRAASCWQPTLKERLLILLGKNIIAVFVDRHPRNFYLKVSNKKEIK